MSSQGCCLPSLKNYENWGKCLTTRGRKMLHRLISLEAFLDKIHHKGEGNWDSRYGFTKRKSCLTNQIAVLDKSLWMWMKNE